jgi:translation initiation factor 1
MGKKRQQEEPPRPEFKVNPFAALKVKAPEAPLLPARPAPPPPPKPPPGSYAAEFTDRALVVRLEKKGRGGKTVTVIAGFRTECEADMQDVAGSLRRLLGTGGTVVEDRLELQGDQRRKAAAWLQGKGFRLKGELG